MKSRFFLLVTALVVSLLMSCSDNSNRLDLSLIPVRSGEKCGYINQKGEYVINPQFANADFFFDGLARVESSEGKIGYIDKKGNYKIEATYKDGTAFSEGLAFVVSEGGHPTCIDTRGNTKFVLEQARYVECFREGLALFSTTDKKYGFVDKAGNVIINPQFERAETFSEGFSAVFDGKNWGFIDKTGKIVINPQFAKVMNFHDGKAAFNSGGQWGFINKKGNIEINPQFDWVMSFYEGMAPFESDEGCGYINEKGEIKINPQFQEALPFQSGLALIYQNGKFGFINKKGNIEINPQFHMASIFFGNIAFVESAGKCGIIDKKGKYIVNPQFNDIMQMERHFDEYENNGDIEYLTAFDGVLSDFYDASPFITKFFERASGTASFDGVTANATANDLTTIPQFKGKLYAGNEEYIIDLRATERIDDISIKTYFHSTTRFWKTVSYYNNAWDQAFEMNKKTRTEFDYSAEVWFIEYQFVLSGDAAGKYGTVAQALKAEIERRYKVEISEWDGIRLPEFREKGYTYGLFTPDKNEIAPNDFNFVITYDNQSVSLLAGFFWGYPFGDKDIYGDSPDDL